MRRVGLYVHVPFCTGKCFYCSFYSVPVRDEGVRRYLLALSSEVERIIESEFLGEAPGLESVFIGGGTPSCLQVDQLAELMRIVCDGFEVLPACELTVESNPETLTAEKVDVLVRAGVNRFSVGAQSFDDKLLARIGRRHKRVDTVRALDRIRSAGIVNINIDLIFGLPGQGLEGWRADLQAALDLGVEHLACYELTYEPGTVIQMEKCTADGPDDELLVRMYYLTKDMLEGAGFEHYEISNYAKAGFICRHNIRYWRNGEYIGLGPAGAGYIRGRRYTNAADLDAYCFSLLERDELPARSAEELHGVALAGETAMLNLRMAGGIERNEFLRQTGFDPFALYADQIARIVDAGLIEATADHIRLTRKGLILANEVIAEFLP